MENEIDVLIDKMIPRGGVAPDCLVVPLDEYLARIGNLHLKVRGVQHRWETWQQICQGHIDHFEKYSTSFLRTDLDGKTSSRSFILSDKRLANEFEMILYSISAALCVLARVIAAFLKGSSSSHSHTNMARVLAAYPQFGSIRILVEKSYSEWVTEMTERRDAATHYIGLSIRSISRSQGENDEEPRVEYTLKVAVPKMPKKSNSIWEEGVPVMGSPTTKGFYFDTGLQIQGLFDDEDKLISVRETTLKQQQMIDGMEYVNTLYKNFVEYLGVILTELSDYLASYKVDASKLLDFEKIINSYKNG